MAKNKSMSTLVALILISAIAIPLATLPAASAHTPPWQIPTYAFINVSPNPVGVGQKTMIVVWLSDTLPGTAEGNNIRFHNFKVTITKPDGSIETRDWPIVWDTTSSAYTAYTPDKVGTYTLKFEFPGQVYTWNQANTPGLSAANAAYENNTYLASSKTTKLTVQQEPLPDPIRSYPLPTEYWTRPIEGQNTDWCSISSHWLGSGSPQLVDGKFRVDPDGIGPNTAHIMWSKPIQDGGVVGGGNVGVEGEGFYTGLTYNRRMGNPIIMYGRLYYQEPLGLSGTGGDTVCVDIRTGVEVWRRTDVPSLSFGYYYDTDTPNMHGVFYEGILFTTNFARAFDARTGTALFNVTGVPTGTAVLGPKGEHLRYSIANAGNTTHPNWRLTQWNSSRLWDMTVMTPTIPSSVDASTANRYDWNVSLPWRTGTSTITIVTAFLNDILLGINGSLPSMTSQAPYTMWAISLKPDSRGQLLWMQTYNPPPGNVTRSIAMKSVDEVNRVFIGYDRETMVFQGYSLEDGRHLWTTTRLPDSSDFDLYNSLGNVGFNTAYGKLYYSGFGGVLHCYDTKNGNLLWTYGNGGPGNSTNSGFETAWGYYPTFITTIADGKVFLETGEHSPNTPLYKGARTRCVNATTGKELWTLLSWGGHHRREGYAVAEGYYIYLNHYDMQIYSVGKGPSATTVTASPKVSVQGSSVLIEGFVTDISAGTKQAKQAARFPNGVPAVSDESMGEWMEYVYMQKPRPMDVKGVEVVLSVLDSNGNFREIGRATSDSNGFYSLMWVPDVPGKYTVYASFAGSESYWPSSAVTAFGVDEAPPAPAEPEPEPPSMTDTYVLGGVAAIILTIIAVGAVLALLVRKRS